MSELARYTWPEAAEILGTGTVAILPIGSTEPHGPHLSLDADVTVALAQSRRAAELLESDGVRAVVLPALPYGLTNLADGFAGRVSLRPGTLWALLEDVVVGVEQQGVRQVVFANGHLEPQHVEILRGVALDHAARGVQRAQVLFPDSSGYEALASGEHAGRKETSIVLAADPEGVREGERAALPAAELDLIAGLRGGARSFLELGAERAYCGDPAAASADEGRELIERLAERLVASVKEAWPELFA